MTICDNPTLIKNEEFMECLIEPTGSEVTTLASDLVKLIDISSHVNINDDSASNRDIFGQYCDITLVSEDIKMPCNQCILAARSEVFCEMLQTAGTKTKLFLHAGKLYVTKHIHPSVLCAFVTYLYTDRCNENFLMEPDSPNATLLLRAASKYQVKGLLALCSCHLIRTLSVENASDVLSLSHECKGTELLKSATLHFIAIHTHAVVETKGFHTLDAALCRLVLEELSNNEKGNYMNEIGKCYLLLVLI